MKDPQMKILVPYFAVDGQPISNTRITGGIEKFVGWMLEHIPGTVPVMYTPEDRKKRRVTDIIVEAAKDCDVVWTNFSNETETLRVQSRISVPMVWAEHSCAGGISSLARVEHMRTFRQRGGKLVMVSQRQFEGWDKVARRVLNEPLQVDGFIDSAFCDAQVPVVTDMLYDLCAIGRAFPTKNPFWAHKIAAATGLRSCVLTDYWGESQEDAPEKQREYLAENAHWTQSHSNWLTLIRLPHAQVMWHLRRSRVFVSTCPGESSGIAALEALSNGVPVICLTDASGTHASQALATRAGGVFTCRPTINSQEFKKLHTRIVEEFDSTHRTYLANLTRERFSRASWSNKISQVIRAAYA
jgi:glycosyltransferase involved in cell wall biosynthesis